MAYGYDYDRAWGPVSGRWGKESRVEAIRKDLDTHGSYWKTFDPRTHGRDMDEIREAADKLGVRVKFRKRRESDPQATPSVTLHAEVIDYDAYVARKTEKIVKAAEKVADMIDIEGGIITYRPSFGVNPLVELKRLVTPVVYCDYPDCDHVPATHQILYPSRPRPNYRCNQHMPKVEKL